MPAQALGIPFIPRRSAWCAAAGASAAASNAACCSGVSSSSAAFTGAAHSSAIAWCSAMPDGLGRISGDHAHTVSTLDLISPERFTLLARSRGEAWLRAAEVVAEELGIEITTLRVGLGGDVQDLYGDFARRSEIGERGCLLVRPDQHIAWRSTDGVADPGAALRRVLAQVLDRDAREKVATAELTREVHVAR